MRVLVADDDATSRNIVSLVLQRSGYDVVVVEDGHAALALLQAPTPPPVAVLDWLMPGLTGPEVIQRLRDAPKASPVYVLMLTTRGDKGSTVEALELGANDYVAKPFDAGELQARVRVGERMVELQAALVNKAEQLQAAAEQIKTLKGILPICASCKKIRDDDGYWRQVEVYVRDHSEAEFSHGLCPDCADRVYSEWVLTSHAPVEKPRPR